MDNSSLELVKISNFPESTDVKEWVVVSDASGNAYKVTRDNFKAFLGTVQVTAPKPINPTDPVPTLDGVYIPTVDGTYANAGGLKRETGEGQADYGMAVEFIKNGAVWVKNTYPISPDINTIKAESRRWLYDGEAPLSQKLRDVGWDNFLIDAYLPDVPWIEGFYVVPARTVRSLRRVTLYYIDESTNTSTSIGHYEQSETIGNISIHRRGIGYLLLDWGALTTTDDVIDSVRRSDGAAFNRDRFVNRIPKKSITANEIAPFEVVFPKYGKNLFNKEAATLGFSMGTNGIPVPNVNYAVSEFIPVDAGKTYIKPNTQTACWFDANKEIIGTYWQAQTQTAITGAKFIRVTVAISQLDTYQLEEGAQQTSFEPFSPIAGYPSINGAPAAGSFEKGIKVFSPRVIPAVVGDNLQLFHSGNANIFNPCIFDAVAVSSVGNSYPRYFQVLPELSDIGDKAFNLKIKRNDASVVAEKAGVIRIVAPMAAPPMTKNILCVGASATANGIWAGEFKRRLTASDGDGTPKNPTGLGLNNINFVGRKIGTVNPVPLEATGGWSWLDFTGQGRNAFRFFVTGITNVQLNAVYSIGNLLCTVAEINVTGGTGEIRCTYTGSGTPPSSGTLTRSQGSGQASIAYTSFQSESYNPFWNNGALDFKNYANLYCNGRIDVIATQMGVNDIFAGRQGAALVEYCKTFARAFKSDFPTGKLILGSLPLPDPFGGMGANYGATDNNAYYIKAIQFLEFAEALDNMAAEAEFSPYVSIAPVVQMFDNEHGYPFVETPVNNRSEVTQKLGTNGVHPNSDGLKMVADAYYRTLNVFGF